MTEMLARTEIPAQAHREPLSPADLLRDVQVEVTRVIRRAVADGDLDPFMATQPVVIASYADAVLEARCAAEDEWWDSFADLILAGEGAEIIASRVIDLS